MSVCTANDSEYREKGGSFKRIFLQRSKRQSTEKRCSPINRFLDAYTRNYTKMLFYWGVIVLHRNSDHIRHVEILFNPCRPEVDVFLVRATVL